MTEKPREYKRRVDAEWRKNERNKNKLIKKIKEYELLDERYKEGIEKEILKNFLEKEKEEKGEEYENILKVIEDVDKKYEALKQLKEELRVKKEEKEQKDREIAGTKLEGPNVTMLDQQWALRERLNKEKEEIEKEIEEKKKEIKDMEEEIKEIEEEYGKKSDVEEVEEEGSIEDKEVASEKTEVINPKALKEYHNQTIKDLWNKDRIRGEIIKILEEGAGIGDELSKKIEEKVSDAFFAYYDEKQGSLRMKAGRREKNKLKERDRGEDIEKGQEEEKTEEIVGTPREKREKLILQWYEKKLNRDELLRILEEEVIMDKKSKKELKEGIMKDFYENYEKAKGENEYQIADAEYRDIKRTTRGLKGKKKELEKKKEERRIEIEGIDEEMQGIGQKAMKLENGSWWNKRKLERFKTRRDELDKQERKIKDEIGKLEMDKLELQLSLKDKEGKYGPKIRWELDRPEKVERKISKEQEESEEEQTTLKGYKERYEQMVKDKEEYNQKLLGAVRDMDMGISEEKKKEVLENVELNMKKEIEELKKGDETTRVADEREKWLEENREIKMKKLLDLKRKIGERERRIKATEGQGTDKVIKEQEYKLKRGLYQSQDEYEQTKTELEEKLKEYDGNYISEEELVVETWKERGERERKEREERERKEREERERKEREEILDSFRNLWKENRKLSEETKNKIIEAADKIRLKAVKELDGSRMIEMRIGGKTYKVLDVNIKECTDERYEESYDFAWMTKYELRLRGMMGDNVDKRENKKLKEYVKKKEREGLHMPKKEEMKSLLKELGEEAGLRDESDQIAMLMYLTGMYGWYWLGDYYYKSDSYAGLRSVLVCLGSDALFRESDHFNASLCMIAS